MKIKTILLSLAAALCLTSCIHMRQDCVYTIYIEEVSVNITPNNDSFDARRVAKNYADKISTEASKQWTSQVNNEYYLEADAEAEKRFNATVETVSRHTLACNKAMENCTGIGTVEIKFNLIMERNTIYTDTPIELGAETFTFYYHRAE